MKSPLVLEYPRNSGRIYTAERYAPICSVVRVTAKPGRVTYSAVAGQDAATSWLCDHSLRKSKARQLIAAALDGKSPDTTGTGSAALSAAGQNGDRTPDI